MDENAFSTLAELSGRVGPRDSPNCHCEGWPSSLGSMGLGGGAGRETADFFLKLGNFFFPPDEEVEGTVEEDDVSTVEGIERSIDAVDFLVLDFILRGGCVLGSTVTQTDSYDSEQTDVLLKSAQVRWGKEVERSMPNCRFQDGGSCTSTNPDTTRVRMTAGKIRIGFGCLSDMRLLPKSYLTDDCRHNPQKSVS
jgi:hypothetical protein